MSFQDKTEAATPRKREDAREDGKVAKSSDLNSSLVFLSALLLLKNAGGIAYEQLHQMMQQSLTNLHPATVTFTGATGMMATCMSGILVACGPILIGTAAVGLASNVLQVGLMFSPKALAPDFSRLDPLKGAMNLVSSRSFVEVGKSVAKIGVVGCVVNSYLREQYPHLMDLSGLSLPSLGSAVAGLCYGLMIRACVAMLAISGIDYMYQRFAFEKSLKMTKQEVKEEFKRSEGDPQIKSRIRQRQREMGRARAMQDVRKADVVVVNPIHFAVAIQYDSENMSAPIVVAKGQRLMAERIKAIAEENHVPIVENIPVARMLYKLVEVGQQIPEDLFQAVAEILAYVYRIGQKTKRS